MLDQKMYYREWRIRNREKIRLDGIVYRAKNKEKIKIQKREYRLNPMVRARQKAYLRKYFLTHMDRARAYKKKWEKENMGTPLWRFQRGRVMAKQRGFEWNISQSDYFELIAKRCIYCDGSLPMIGTGLDRMDCDKGYVIGNVVPCCFSCNKVKNDVLSFEEMRAAMAAVKEVRLKKALQGTAQWP